MNGDCCHQGSSRLFKQWLTAAVSAQTQPPCHSTQGAKLGASVKECKAMDSSQEEAIMADQIITQGLKNIGRSNILTEGVDKKAFRPQSKGRGRGKPELKNHSKAAPLHNSNNSKDLLMNGAVSCIDLNSGGRNFNDASKASECTKVALPNHENSSSELKDPNQQNMNLSNAKSPVHVNSTGRSDLPDLLRCQLSLEENSVMPDTVKAGDVRKCISSKPMVTSFVDAGAPNDCKSKTSRTFTQSTLHNTECGASQQETPRAKQAHNNDATLSCNQGIAKEGEAESGILKGQASTEITNINHANHGLPVASHGKKKKTPPKGNKNGSKKDLHNVKTPLTSKVGNSNSNFQALNGRACISAGMNSDCRKEYSDRTHTKPRVRVDQIHAQDIRTGTNDHQRYGRADHNGTKQWQDFRHDRGHHRPVNDDFHHSRWDSHKGGAYNNNRGYNTRDHCSGKFGFAYNRKDIPPQMNRHSASEFSSSADFFRSNIHDDEKMWDKRNDTNPVHCEQDSQGKDGVKDTSMEDWDMECREEEKRKKHENTPNVAQVVEMPIHPSKPVTVVGGSSESVVVKTEIPEEKNLSARHTSASKQKNNTEASEIVGSSKYLMEDQKFDNAKLSCVPPVHKTVTTINSRVEIDKLNSETYSQGNKLRKSNDNDIHAENMIFLKKTCTELTGDTDLKVEKIKEEHAEPIFSQEYWGTHTPDRGTVISQRNNIEVADKCESVQFTPGSNCNMSASCETFKTAGSDEIDSIETKTALPEQDSHDSLQNVDFKFDIEHETRQENSSPPHCLNPTSNASEKLVNLEMHIKEEPLSPLPEMHIKEEPLSPLPDVENLEHKTPAQTNQTRPLAESSHTSDICSKSSSDFFNSTYSEVSSENEAEICSQSESGGKSPSPNKMTGDESRMQAASFPFHPYFNYQYRYPPPTVPHSENRSYSSLHPEFQRGGNCPGKAFTQAPFMRQPNYPGGYWQPPFLPPFPPQKLMLPANIVGTNEAVNKMMMFMDRCCADMEEYLDTCKKSCSPVNLAITVGLSAHGARWQPSSMATPHPTSYSAEPCAHRQPTSYFDTPPFSSMPIPPPPYWQWRQLSEWYSRNMDTSLSDIASSFNPSYPGMSYPPPQPAFAASQGSSKTSAPSHAEVPNDEHCHPWMYSFWDHYPRFDYTGQMEETKLPHCKTQSHLNRSMDGMSADLNKTKPTVHEKKNSEESSSEYKNLNNDNRESSEADSNGLENLPEEMPSKRPSRIAAWSKKGIQNFSEQESGAVDTVEDNVDGEHKPSPSVEPSEKSTWRNNDNRTEYMKQSSVSRYLSAELLKNEWQKQPPPIPRVHHMNRTSQDKPSHSLRPIKQEGNNTGRNSYSQSYGEKPDNMSMNSVNAVDSQHPYKFLSEKFSAFVPKVTKAHMPRLAGSDSMNWREHCAPLDCDDQTSPLSRNSELCFQMKKRRSPEMDASEELMDKNCSKRRASGPAGYGMSTYSNRQWGDSQFNSSSASSTLSELEDNYSIMLEWAKRLITRSKHYSNKFIDSHCHIDFLYSKMDLGSAGLCMSFQTFKEKYAQFFPANYEGCVAVFCNPRTFCNENPRDNILTSVASDPGVWLALGCHPKNAQEFRHSHVLGLRKMLQHPKVVALGEIGLDYSGIFGQYEEIQKRVFREQLKIALEMKLPLVIHCREADDDCLEILLELVPRDYKIHAHCFTRNISVAWRWLAPFPNLFLGLTPIISYRSAIEAINTAIHIPLDRLLLETDAPYFVPGSIRNKEPGPQNSYPGFALCTAEKVAELKGIPVDEVLKACRENTQKMYGI